MMSGISSQVHKGKPIVMNTPLNVVITPLHRFTTCNRLMAKTVVLRHKALGHWLLSCPFHFAPPEVQGDQYQLGPKALGKYLQRKCTADLVAWQKKNFPPSNRAWKRGRGVPVEWFTPLQQRHILLQRCGTVPVMVELAVLSGCHDPRCLLVLRTAGHETACMGLHVYNRRGYSP